MFHFLYKVGHGYHWYQEVADLNPDCLIDNVFDYQSMKSGTDPSSEIPMHEELTNAADSPTLADFLHQDVTGEKEVISVIMICHFFSFFLICEFDCR